MNRADKPLSRVAKTEPERSARGILAIGLAALAVSGVLLVVTAPARAADCGETAGPTGERVACSCGDTAVTDVRMRTSDPIVSAACDDGSGLAIGASDITIDCLGKTLAGVGFGTGIGTQFGVSVSGVTVRRCVVTGFFDGITLGAASSDSAVIGNDVSDNVRVGILVGTFGNEPNDPPGLGNVVSRNTVSGQAVNVVSQLSAETEISRNTISSAEFIGIQFVEASRQQVFANTIDGSERFGLTGSRLSDSEIANNEIMGCETTAISVIGDDNQVIGNTLRQNGFIAEPLFEGVLETFALRLGGSGPLASSGNLVSGNVLEGNNRGIVVLGANDNRIADNTISNADRMGVLHVSRLLGVRLGMRNTFENNLIAGFDFADFELNEESLVEALGPLEHVNVFERHVAVDLDQPPLEFRSAASQSSGPQSFSTLYRAGAIPPLE